MTGRVSLAVILLLNISLTSVSAQSMGGYAGIYDSDVSVRMRSHVSFLASEELDGRAAGTEGEKAAAVFLGKELESSGVTLLSPEDGDIFGIRLPDGDTLTSRNIIGIIPGYDKTLKDKYILIGARIDNAPSIDVTVDGQSVHKIYRGANGNASGLSLMLSLARKLSESKILLRRSVLIAGFGSSLRQHAGAWYFLNRSFPDVSGIDAMVDLDMVGIASGGFYAYTGANEDLNAVIGELSSTLQPIKPALVPIPPCEGDYAAFQDRQIPSVLFTTGRYHEYMTDRDTPDILEYDNMERELEYLFNFIVALASRDDISFLHADRPKDAARKPAGTVNYFDCDRKPSFLGSTDPRDFLSKWVYQYLKYPDGAIREGIQGKVLVDFVIDRTGRVTNVSVRRGVHELLDAEAVRVIEASPRWRPGYLGGAKVDSALSLYVEFRLEKKK